MDAIAGDKGLVSLLKARRDFTSVEQALQRARRENVEAREQARRLREDPSAIEELARRELGLIKPDELLLIIRDVEPEEIAAAACRGCGSCRGLPQAGL